MRRLTLGAALLVLAGCAGKPSPVPVLGPASDVRALAGEWTGEYQSPETGRSGSITFKLAAGSDTAFGDVLMVPKGAFPQATEPGTPDPRARANPQILTIRFVHVSDHQVSGTILPYLVPDCECWLETRFGGELSGNRITGDFVSHDADTGRLLQRGTWWAKRTGEMVKP
jgi:hypothetical protein